MFLGDVGNGNGLELSNMALAYVTQKALHVFSVVGGWKIEPPRAAWPVWP
jgi:hypothetical protein